jgi:HYDIN/CFA65/VesB family protein
VKTLVCALALVAGFGATAARAADTPATAPSPAAPRIVVEPGSFDFGSVKVGKQVQKEFLIRNHGSLELVLDVVSDCNCTAALPDSKTVKPGGSTPLRVTFTASDVTGRVQKSVIVKSNDPARPAVEVKIEATVVAAKKP